MKNIVNSFRELFKIKNSPMIEQEQEVSYIGRLPQLEDTYPEPKVIPLPPLEEGFMRQEQPNGSVYECRADKTEYINEKGQREMARIYDKYGRLSSAFIMLDLSK